MELNDFMPERLPLPLMPDVRLAVCRIESGPRGSRRRREQAAVNRLLDFFFPDGAVYAHRSDGSPYIEDCDSFVSVSHSAGYAAMVLSPSAGIGVDIEEMRPAQLRRVAERFLSERERRLFTSDSTLLWAWCAKEAVYKSAAMPGLGGPEIELDTPFCNEARVGDSRFRLATLFTAGYCMVVSRPE